MCISDRTCNSSNSVLILGGTVKKWNRYLDDTFGTNKCGNMINSLKKLSIKGYQMISSVQHTDSKLSDECSREKAKEKIYIIRRRIQFCNYPWEFNLIITA